jgi:hypothetical protein
MLSEKIYIGIKHLWGIKQIEINFINHNNINIIHADELFGAQ